MAKQNGATQNQIAYATKLGLAIQEGTTSLECSDILERHLSRDTVAPEWMFNYAVKQGLQVSKYMGESKLRETISVFLTGRDQVRESVIWFVYTVARHFEDYTWDDPKQSKVTEDRVRSVADALVSDDKVVSSVRRYGGDILLRFGEQISTDGGVFMAGSTRTLAFKRVASLLQPESTM